MKLKRLALAAPLVLLLTACNFKVNSQGEVVWVDTEMSCDVRIEPVFTTPEPEFTFWSVHTERHVICYHADGTEIKPDSPYWDSDTMGYFAVTDEAR